MKGPFRSRQGMRGFVAAASGAACMIPCPALAYVTPGAGSVAVQLIVGVVAALLVAGHSLWHRGARRLRGWTRGGRSRTARK